RRRAFPVKKSVIICPTPVKRRSLCLGEESEPLGINPIHSTFPESSSFFEYEQERSRSVEPAEEQTSNYRDWNVEHTFSASSFPPSPNLSHSSRSAPTSPNLMHSFRIKAESPPPHSD